MEHLQDFWKRNSVQVIGRPIERIPELRAITPCRAEELDHKACEDHFLLVHFENSSEADEQLRLLSAKGFTHDQILVLADSGDSAEELRLRIFVQVELARQRRLELEIASATQNGALQFLHWNDPSAETRALDRARHAHALSCALQLGPAKHSRCIRLALFLDLSHSERITALKSVRHIWPVAPLLERRAAYLGSVWPTEIPLELALAECAHLAVEARDPMQFREFFREKSAKLPFRLRGELRGAIERCFAQLWKGGSRAA